MVLAVFFFTLSVGIIRARFFVPRVYQAQATLMPLKEEAGRALRSLGAVSEIVGGGALTAVLGGGDKERLAEILRSQTLQEQVLRDLKLLTFLIRDDLARARRRHPEIHTSDARRVALELIQAHPEIVRISADSAPETAILSMSDETLTHAVEGLGRVEGNLDQASLSKIRQAWHREVAQAIAKFRKGVSVDVMRTDLIIVRVRVPEDRFLVAHVVNRLVDKLEAYLRENSLTRAQRNRLFLEERVTLVQGDLTRAERALESFKRQNRLVSFSDQLRELVTQAATVEGELEAKRLGRDVLLRTGVSPQNPRIKALSQEIAGLEQQVGRMDQGGKGFLSGVGIRQAPEIERELMELMRDRTLQETLYQILIPEYEMAKIEEAREQPGFQVLDRAQPPAEPVQPRLMIDLVLSAMLGGLLALLAVYAVESISRIRSQRVAGGNESA
jgi:uncharacterized protein involved in exopolysaccharide biosynthesis